MQPWHLPTIRLEVTIRGRGGSLIRPTSVRRLRLPCTRPGAGGGSDKRRFDNLFSRCHPVGAMAMEHISMRIVVFIALVVTGCGRADPGISREKAESRLNSRL